MRRRPILSICLGLALLLGIVTVVLLITSTTRQKADLAKLADALKPGYWPMAGHSSRLPRSVNDAVWRWLMGDNPSALPGNHWRIQSADYLRGAIESMSIHGSGGPLGENAQAALARFTSLQRLRFNPSGELPLENAVERFCAAARQLPKLNELVIVCEEIRDTSLEPLRGHPALKRITIELAKTCTPRSIDPLRTLPALQELRLGDPSDPRTTYSPEDKNAITSALPSVQIRF